MIYSSLYFIPNTSATCLVDIFRGFKAIEEAEKKATENAAKKAAGEAERKAAENAAKKAAEEAERKATEEVAEEEERIVAQNAKKKKEKTHNEFKEQKKTF